MAQGFDKHGESGHRLAPARIIKMIAGIGRAPVCEHTAQAALRDIRLSDILGHIGNAKSRHRSVEHLEGAVKGKLSFDMHVQLASVLLELPGIKSSSRRQAQINAVVIDQLLRCFWSGRVSK